MSVNAGAAPDVKKASEEAISDCAGTRGAASAAKPEGYFASKKHLTIITNEKGEKCLSAKDTTLWDVLKGRVSFSDYRKGRSSMAEVAKFCSDNKIDDTKLKPAYA